MRYIVEKKIRVYEEDWIAFKRYAARFGNMADAFSSLSEVKNEKRIAGMIVERIGHEKGELH